MWRFGNGRAMMIRLPLDGMELKRNMEARFCKFLRTQYLSSKKYIYSSYRCKEVGFDFVTSDPEDFDEAIAIKCQSDKTWANPSSLPECKRKTRSYHCCNILLYILSSALLPHPPDTTDPSQPDIRARGMERPEPNCVGEQDHIQVLRWGSQQEN